MGGLEALIAAAIVAGVAVLCMALISVAGRAIDAVLMAWRVWRTVRRHPRAPVKRFPWGRMLTGAFGVLSLGPRSSRSRPFLPKGCCQH
jgi:hypothetical protein